GWVGPGVCALLSVGDVAGVSLWPGVTPDDWLGSVVAICPETPVSLPAAITTSKMSGTNEWLLIPLTDDPPLFFASLPGQRPSHEGDAILHQDVRDLCLVFPQQAVELLLPGLVPFAHSHGNLVRERN